MSDANNEDPIKTALRLGMAEREDILRSARLYDSVRNGACNWNFYQGRLRSRAEGRAFGYKSQSFMEASFLATQGWQAPPGLAALGTNTDLAAMVFFESPNIHLDEQTAKEALLAGEPELVLGAAHVFGKHGASVWGVVGFICCGLAWPANV